LEHVSIHDFLFNSPWSWVSLLAITAVTLIIRIVLYRRYFHPLAKIPGPFLPAVTYLYQSYYNMDGGRFYTQIEKLHKEYGIVSPWAYLDCSDVLICWFAINAGPVVRINPDEIHLSDPENYEKIYSHSSNFHKAPYF